MNDGAIHSKVVIKRRVLGGSNEPDHLQKVATVYINGSEYRVYAPSEAEGDALDWMPHCFVRQLADFDSEVGAGNSESHLALRLVAQELERQKEHASTLLLDTRQPAGTEPAKIEVFISHSGADARIARELIDLLRSAIPDLRPEVIRCTSVAGYRLEGGTKTEEQIQKELLGAKVFIGLLSKYSLKSTYVLFELGARWGARLHLMPLTVAGMNPSELKPPLNSLNAHSAAVDSDLFQLVGEVASRMELQIAKPQVYGEHIKRLVQISQEQAKEQSNGPAPMMSPSLPERAPSEATLLADLVSELEDNLEHARVRRIGDVYLHPSSEAWRTNRNRLRLQESLRSEVTQIYREIETWRTIVESGVHPNMGSPALDLATSSLSGRLPSIIAELRKLLLQN